MNDELPTTYEAAVAEIAALRKERDQWKLHAIDAVSRFSDSTNGWFRSLQAMRAALQKGMHHSRVDLQTALDLGIASYGGVTAVEREKEEGQ